MMKPVSREDAIRHFQKMKEFTVIVKGKSARREPDPKCELCYGDGQIGQTKNGDVVLCRCTTKKNYVAIGSKEAGCPEQNVQVQS